MSLLGIKDMSASYGELMLVERPAIELLESLGWTHANLYTETFGDHGTEGRESEHHVILYHINKRGKHSRMHRER